MQISIKSNVRQLERKLLGFKKQVPFATARALSNIAYGARQSTVKQIDKDVNKPKPFTKKSPRYKRATKANQTAIVYIMPIAFNYLSHLVNGGRVMPKRSKIVIGVNARRNQYGNTTRKGINTLLARPDTFIATIKGIHGIWKRYGGKAKNRVKLMYVFVPSTNYQANQFKYFANVQKFVLDNFNSELSKSIHQAIKSARL